MIVQSEFGSIDGHVDRERCGRVGTSGRVGKGRAMASYDPQDFGFEEPPPRPSTPPVRRGFLLVLFVLSIAALIVYGVPYVADRTGYAWEAGRARAATEALAKLEKAGAVQASALFRLAVTAVSPAVVNVQSQRARRGAEAMPGLPVG